jgi:hypothetical protein
MRQNPGENAAIVVTSISAPNEPLRLLARGAALSSMPFFVIGDTNSPQDFALEGCDFYDIQRQVATDLRTARLVPERHYARKNIGYLLAARSGADVIIETDDDNLPRDAFWFPRMRKHLTPYATECGWINVYSYFSDAPIWPRGFPLDRIHDPHPLFEGLPVQQVDCPIQQGLAGGNPDVDAIYRLILPLPQEFRDNRRVALGRNAWCPFNSQNTTTWRDAYPLLYLPSFCSFRMTDIWRSFIAQRIAWENGWSILFHEATVRQERNEHNLMRDFRDEIPGYLHNSVIADVLSGLTLHPGVGRLGDNLLTCYKSLIRASILERAELPLLEAWLNDLNQLGVAC